MRPTDEDATGPAVPAEALRDTESVGIDTGLVTGSTFFRYFDRVLGYLPATILFVMMMLTFVNVGMRYILRQPISGALELLSYMMGLLVFLSLPLVTARAEHVRISLLDGIVPHWLRRLRSVVFNLVMAVACAFLARRLWLYGDRLAGWGEKTQMYGLPLGPMAWMMAVCTAVCAALFVLLAVRVVLERDFVREVET